jgi:hypothetical protein
VLALTSLFLPGCGDSSGGGDPEPTSMSYSYGIGCVVMWAAVEHVVHDAAEAPARGAGHTQR